MLKDIEHTAATLTCDGGLPVVLRWEDNDWRVLDAPTRLDVSDAVASSPFLTHPPATWSGWRFTAQSDGMTTYVFDVRQLECDHYEVLHVYE